MIPDSVRQIMSSFFSSLSLLLIQNIIYSYHSVVSLPKSLQSCHMIFSITAGVAVLLTIITYFSSPILTTIFGDGSLEVSQINNQETILLLSVLNQGEDAKDWAYDEPVLMEVKFDGYEDRFFQFFHSEPSPLGHDSRGEQLWGSGGEGGPDERKLYSFWHYYPNSGGEAICPKDHNRLWGKLLSEMNLF